jgi:hypothetical protein
MKKVSTSPFRQLELQLKLDKLDKEWEEARKIYYKNKEANVEMVDEILKISVEKIKVLSEIYMTTYEA